MPKCVICGKAGCEIADGYSLCSKCEEASIERLKAKKAKAQLALNSTPSQAQS